MHKSISHVVDLISRFTCEQHHLITAVTLTEPVASRQAVWACAAPTSRRTATIAKLKRPMASNLQVIKFLGTLLFTKSYCLNPDLIVGANTKLLQLPMQRTALHPHKIRRARDVPAET
jgi:hypothetical protein